MCLGIPMQILSINDHLALCEANGIRREVNLFMLQHAPPSVGDYVLVHVGYAIQTVDPAFANQARQLLDQISPRDA